MNEWDDWSNRSTAWPHDVIKTEKLYKAIAIVSHGNADGTREICRDEKEVFFDKLEDAVDFIDNNGGMIPTVWDQVSGRIFESEVVKSKELKRKTRPVEVVTKTEAYWG